MSLLDSEDFNDRLFVPRRDVSAPPDGAVDLFVTVTGAKLHLRLHHADRPRATVLLFHGNGEVVADYDDAAPAFARANAALAVVDFRGYGRSSGAPTLRKIIEDAPAVLDGVASQAEAPIIVMGRSLGSACAIELYARSPQRVAGFILESGFVDLDALVHRRGMAAVTIDREDRATFDPLPKLRRGTRPLLVLHGSLDDLIAPNEATIAFESAGGAKKTLVSIEGRRHNDISDSEDYWTALRHFVEDVT